MSLDLPTVKALLEAHAVAPPDAQLTLLPLAGGVSGEVVLVATAGRPLLVLKQARARLEVQAEWYMDPARSSNEGRCLRYLASILPAGSVPTVRFVDQGRNVLAMDVIPTQGRIWKQQLMAGLVDLETAQRVGSLLGRVHGCSVIDLDALARFENPHLLRQGRTDPYHRAAAVVNSDLAGAIEAEAQRLERTRIALVLGDVSPKNVVVFEDHIMLLDVEIAHWGDPAFDVAFCLTHLLLKSLVLESHRDGLLLAALSLWESYSRATPCWPELEQHVIAEVGCLLLARVDGRSPVEYITEDATKHVVRRIARTLLCAPGITVAELPGAVRCAATILEHA